MLSSFQDMRQQDRILALEMKVENLTSLVEFAHRTIMDMNQQVNKVILIEYCQIFAFHSRLYRGGQWPTFFYEGCFSFE